MRLFCFPYAGGSAVIYNQWDEYLQDHIQLFPVELAGRGKRINESCYSSIDEAAEDVIRNIKYRLFDLPFSFFGHSMGGAIAYQVSLKLKEKSYPQPKHIFFSGRGAPHVSRKDKEPFHTMPESQFRDKIMELGGTPKEFFQHPELLEILLPTLRSDFRLSWIFNQQFTHMNLNPLDCDISVLTGTEDDLLDSQIKGWANHTTKSCRFYSFEGGHFYINNGIQRVKVIDIINETLLNVLKRRTSAVATSKTI